MSRNTKLLSLALFFILVITISVTYYKTVVLKDFPVINENYSEDEEVEDNLENYIN
jgi:hypothetical protein